MTTNYIQFTCMLHITCIYSILLYQCTMYSEPVNKVTMIIRIPCYSGHLIIRTPDNQDTLIIRTPDNQDTLIIRTIDNQDTLIIKTP